MSVEMASILTLGGFAVAFAIGAFIMARQALIYAEDASVTAQTVGWSVHDLDDRVSRLEGNDPDGLITAPARKPTDADLEECN